MKLADIIVFPYLTQGNSVLTVSTPKQSCAEARWLWRSNKEWPIWECGESEFPWHHDQTEVCYVLGGQVSVISDSGESVGIIAGDLVRFPAGMDCRWLVRKPIRKHYSFEQLKGLLN